MNLITTVEIDNHPVQVCIEFKSYFGHAEVIEITDFNTGDAIDCEISDSVYNQLGKMYDDLIAEKILCGIFN